MPFTEQELQNYQFYLQLKEERDKKYQDFYEEAISESDSTTRNHLLVKTLIHYIVLKILMKKEEKKHHLVELV